MVPISKDTWEEIISNQKLPLTDTTEPKSGNGYHDGISFGKPFQNLQRQNNLHYNSNSELGYFKLLGNRLNPIIIQNNSYTKGYKIKNYSENYKNTLLKYFANENYFRKGDSVPDLYEWGQKLSLDGRVIFEIIGWFDSKSSQFYAFKLNPLDINHCKITKKDIIYKVPFKSKGEKDISRKVKIPKSKCIIIDFPQELGGYEGFTQKIKRIKNLGNKFECFDNINEQINYTKNWKKQFNKIVSNWGNPQNIEDCTSFYQELSLLKFKYMTILCTHELINGLKQLINYLNINFKEEASLELDAQHYDKDKYKEMIIKWMNGKLSFKEANILR